MFARAFEGWHIVIIAIVVLILFGSKKLPDAARSFGRSLRILKAETKGLRDDRDGAPQEAPGYDAASRDRQQAQYVPPPLPPGQDAIRESTPSAADVHQARREER